MRVLQLGFLFAVLFITSNTAFAQKVTFNVNLKPQLEDSIFVPGRDNLRIVGNVAPINTATPIYLIDSEPIDSIYSVTINFSPRYRNQTIPYNFEMTVNYRKFKESLERRVALIYGETSLDPLYFDSFAW